MMIGLLSKLLNVDLTTPSEPVDTNVSEDEVWELPHPKNKHELLNSDLWELLQSEKYDEVILRAGKLLGDKQGGCLNCQSGWTEGWQPLQSLETVEGVPDFV